MSVSPFLKLQFFLMNSWFTLPFLDDVVGDEVEDGQVGLRLEDHGDVGQVEAAVLEGGEHGHLGLGCERRRSVTRVHRMGCISAMLLPQSTKASACSMSS